MTKTIAQLWNGNINPIKSLNENNPEIKNLENLMERNLDNLLKEVNGKSKEIFEKYNDCIEEYLTLTTEQAFFDGFCLGTKLIIETFSLNYEE